MTIHKGAAALLAIALLLAGAAAAYVFMRSRESADAANGRAIPTSPAPTPATPPATTGAAAGTPPDTVITLTADAVERAGIVVTAVETGRPSGALRLPGVVEPNAYRQVDVTPLAGGRVTRVSAELGANVRRGQVLARIYSPELAEAQTKYTSAKAILDAHDRELQRTQKLLEIGAASRQELERIHAEHTAQTAEVESARARLRLLGADADNAAAATAEGATVAVAAPIDGVVTERLANAGANVDPAMKLFSIVDLSSVWIVADVNEKDLGLVREGAAAIVTSAAYPDLSFRGRVSYIDPRISGATRTGRARIEVANPGRQLRLGMYTDVGIETGQSASVVTVPKGAIQNVADRQVVYVAASGEHTKFFQREVRVGDTSGDAVEVLSGLNPGDAVVSKGSFFVRAEAERLGIRTAADVQTATVAVTDKGYEPERVTLRAGVAARLTFVRKSDKTCGTEIVVPALNVKRALPLHEPVVIEFTPAKAGDIEFACGMNMLKGVIVVF